ncbi:transposase [Legionella qingyii]|uniref:Transposase n=1 Tax=Legionella qingyii TaxID=2184757 RepID=A0A317U0Q4_9GAMM|nr:DUF6262 family protein [Legionella qingyii]PWY54072.1 transposase [Legionella qingyii]RUR19892.1 transposase [Legionella qingyii]RUR22365.1 transposase [Legionella qingyii]
MNKGTENQIKALKEAARGKRAATIERVLVALKAMEEQSLPINFESVASFAKVSKTWLYASDEIKELIIKAKNEDGYNLYMKNQAAKLITKDKEISVLIKQNKMLRQEIDELKKQLEVAYAALYKKED